jgi:hypothetical protein
VTVLNLDLDGVVYNFVGKFAWWFGERNEFGAPLPPVRHWAFYEDWGLSKAEFNMAVDLFAQEGGFNDDRFVDREFVSELNAIRRAHDLKVRVLSHKNGLLTRDGSRAAMRDTIAVLFRVGLDVDDYVFVGNTASKADYPCDFAIDDNPDVHSWAIGSRLNLLWSQPWNMVEWQEKWKPFSGNESIHDPTKAIVIARTNRLERLRKELEK